MLNFASTSKTHSSGQGLNLVKPFAVCLSRLSYFLRREIPASFTYIFAPFQTNYFYNKLIIKYILQVPSIGIQTHYLCEYTSPPLTTRPGLHPTRPKVEGLDRPKWCATVF